jgi:DNA-binding winged helix-turn-helix (wHTH) protein
MHSPAAAMAEREDEEVYRFGAFRLTARPGLLEHENVRVPLTPKTLLTLAVLVRNANRVIEQDKLMAEIWPGLFVARQDWLVTYPF